MRRPERNEGRGREMKRPTWNSSTSDCGAARKDRGGGIGASLLKLIKIFVLVTGGTEWNVLANAFL